MAVEFSQFMRERVASQWASVRRPRPFLERVAVTGVLVAVSIIALVVLLVAAVVAVPVALVLTAWWWVRARLPRARSDGRRNVRVRAPGVGGPA